EGRDSRRGQQHAAGGGAAEGQAAGHHQRVEPARLRLRHLRGWHAGVRAQLAMRGRASRCGNRHPRAPCPDPRTPGKWQAMNIVSGEVDVTLQGGFEYGTALGSFMGADGQAAGRPA
ncbi:unnamed protein product, partial [Prorocentrum cordatum]